MSYLWIAFLLLLALVGFAFYAYNRFVYLRTHKQEAWSGIDVQLKRRHDLLPALVETVKGYAKHEQGVLEQVTSLRSQTQGVDDPKRRGDLEGALSKQVGKIFALVEAYPDLKADSSFLKLQDDLTEIEDKIQYARRYYNATVRDLNIKVQSVPWNIIANLGGFEKAEFFELEYATERAAPDVSF